MTVIVTGASGFLGRHVVDWFLTQGRDVVALTRNPGRLDARARLRVVETDYTSFELHPESTIVHLAGVRNTPGTATDRLWNVNVEVTRRIGEAALRAGVRRFIHVGTALVLGPSATPLDAHSPFAESADPYISSKLAGVRALEAIEELPLVTLLPSLIYGPDHRLAPNRITSHIRRLRDRRWRVAVSGASAPRNLVYVADVVQAIERAEREAVGTRTVVAGDDVTQERFERAVYAALNRKPALRIVVPGAVARTATRAMDWTVRRDQGWSRRLETLLAPWCFRSSHPYTPLEQGIAQTVRSL